MLCSAQDYRPGQAGLQEHIWQATMGPELWSLSPTRRA